MDFETLVEKTKMLEAKFKTESYNTLLLQLQEFLKNYGGINSSFYLSVKGFKLTMLENERAKSMLYKVFISFKQYLEDGLLSELSPKRQTEVDVVSDYLSQAEYLLEDSRVHAAVPISIIGSSIEQFLRNWIEDAGLMNEITKPTIDSYVTILRKNELLTKQDLKDIVSWAGLRNSAAHGKWEDVCDKKQATIMLQGVNLFIRKYTEH